MKMISGCGRFLNNIKEEIAEEVAENDSVFRLREIRVKSWNNEVLL